MMRSKLGGFTYDNHDKLV